MIFVNNGKEEIIESIYVTPEDPRASFYHMHIYKTSGLSLKANIVRMFTDVQCYNNFIGLYDEKQVLSSKLVSGHFFRTPIEDFKKQNKKLHSITLIRNPIDRMISHFKYEMHLNNQKNVTIEKFIKFLYSEQKNIENLQSKNISSTMDTYVSNLFAQGMITGNFPMFQNLQALGQTNRYISKNTNESKWQDFIEDFSLIGTLDKRQKFMGRLHQLLLSEGYKGGFGQEEFANSSEFNTEKFKETLPKDVIDKIYDLNKYDFELYEHLVSRGL
jgi:hypothetical protein